MSQEASYLAAILHFTGIYFSSDNVRKLVTQFFHNAPHDSKVKNENFQVQTIQNSAPDIKHLTLFIDFRLNYRTCETNIMG